MKENQMDFHALILAGGIGVRLWPKSRYNHPKQFLSVNSDNTLLTKTVNRIKGFFADKNIWILCKKSQQQEVKKLLPDFPETNIILEPSPKGTGAAVVYGSLFIEKNSSDSVVTIFPSDHIITQEQQFIEYIKAGLLWAKENNVIVIYGIKPDSPETSYGYIEIGATKGHCHGFNCMEVRRFHEKPDRRTAKAYFDSKRFLWNSGMFCFRPKVLKTLIKERQFAIWQPVLEIIDNEKESFSNKEDKIKSTYSKLPEDPFDTAFLEKLVSCHGDISPEKAPELVVFPCNFRWYDMGVWSSYYKFFKKDSSGNALIGKAVSLDCKGCLIVSDFGLTAAIGLEDMVIIHEKDAILVCHKKQLDRIKELVDILKEKGFKEFV